MVSHDCRLDWCDGDRGGSAAANCEHYGKRRTTSATGTVGTSDLDDEIPTITVQLWWNADTDPAPHIHVAVGSGGTADLQISEAVLLAEYLRRAINEAASGTNLDPARIIEHLGRHQ